MIAGAIPFEVPDAWMADLAARKLVRYGPLLKDAGTGRIVAHLQETGALQQALKGGTGLFDMVQSLPGSPLGAVSGFGTLVQNEQIKGGIARIEGALGTMQTLQVASLATGVVGIGVTVASTAIVLNRLARIETDLAARIDAVPDAIEHRDLMRDLGDLRTALARLDEFRGERRFEEEAADAERHLDRLFGRFAEALRQIAGQEGIDGPLTARLAAGLGASAGAQIEALVALDDVGQARKRALRHDAEMRAIAMALPADRLRAAGGEGGPSGEALADGMTRLRHALAARPSLLERIEGERVAGPDYLARAREWEGPLAVLPA